MSTGAPLPPHWPPPAPRHLLCTCEEALYDNPMTKGAEIGWIGGAAALLDPATYGQKAAWLARTSELGLPVPLGFVLPATMAAEPEAHRELIEGALATLEASAGVRLGDPEAPLLLSVRPSAPGGVGTAPSILNIGVSEATLYGLTTRFGGQVAQDLYRRLIQSYGAGALGVDSDDFEYALYDALKDAGVDSETELGTDDLADLCRICLSLIEEVGEDFPQDPRDQLFGALGALAKAWSSPRARLVREAKGGDAEAGLPLIVQTMVMGLGENPCGAGIAHPRDEVTGLRGLNGRFLATAQGDEALMGLRTPTVLTVAEREAEGLSEPSLEEISPQAVALLSEAGDRLEEAFGETFTLEFTVSAGVTHILEAKPARRSARAAVRIAVELAERGAISREESLLRVDPAFLDDHLHPSIAPDAARDQIGQGLPASPGAVSGPLVFSPDQAEVAAAAGRPAILALIETSPEDIRGMHAALGVLTVRGGMTSHAAVVARGLGRPCVVGAKDMELDRREDVLRTRDGRVFRAGDVVTVDGGDGDVLAGAIETVPPEITGAFATLMEWADDARRMGVRANADTRSDALVRAPVQCRRDRALPHRAHVSSNVAASRPCVR